MTLVKNTDVLKMTKPMKRLEKKAQTRRLLIDAALTLSAQVGFAGLSLREVTREAGVAPTTFYRHFHDMDDLGLCLIDEVGLSLRQLMRKARIRVSQNKSLVRTSIETFMEYVHQNGNLFHLLLGERSGSSKAFRRAIRDEINRFVGELTEDLERENAPAKPSTLNYGLVAEAIVAVVFTVGAEALDLPAHRRKDLAERLIQEVKLILLGAQALLKK